ncbi:MAG: RDD family protein [Gemmatimonadales bacterium]
MKCPACERETALDRVFCTWCEAFLPNPPQGTSAGLFRRFMAAAIDPLLFWVAWMAGSMVLVPVLGAWGALLAVLGLAVWYLVLLGRGTTFGKELLGERVVLRTTGMEPGALRMLVRETVGKALSGLPFGLGYLWALWDPCRQTWHDKLVGTVVIQRRPKGTKLPAQAGAGALSRPASTLAAALTLLTTPGVQAQFQAGTSLIGPTAGVSGVGSSAAIGAHFERAVTDRAAWGAFVQYWSYGADQVSQGVSYGIDYRYFAFGGTGAYHFAADDERLDPFVGGGVGYYVVSLSGDGGFQGLVDERGSRVFVAVFGGLRYFVSPAIAVVGRAGVGPSYLTLGVDFRL